MMSSQVCKYDIEESISREMSGDLKDGMLTIGVYDTVQCHVHVTNYLELR